MGSLAGLARMMEMKGSSDETPTARLIEEYGKVTNMVRDLYRRTMDRLLRNAR